MIWTILHPIPQKYLPDGRNTFLEALETGVFSGTEGDAPICTEANYTS